ncbi:MAG: cupin domain-containing protein [Anaerolineae bacterium]|nr:cupin domain-containing protein [Anaerolineae bacterium]MCA9894690.1 cupin domain-containing protein [Anaerolineae bacterium]
MATTYPFATEIDFKTGVFSPKRGLIQRRLSDMKAMYADVEAAEKILQTEGDRLIYEVQVTELPEEEGQILHCTTIIYPGQIGDEFHMTKGHFHARREQGEVYFGLSGEGFLLQETEEGETSALPMQTGTAAYVPPYWAHRTMNTGTEPFVFFAAWPGEAGHDYGTIEELGFRKLIVNRNGRVQIVDNPRYT